MIDAFHEYWASRPSRTAQKISEVLATGRPALIGYLPNGFPNKELGLAAAKTMIDAGVDIVELGIPYTDPVMDGPTIQRAAEAALAAGSRPADVFDTIKALNDYRPDVPVLVMSYFNPILKHGVQQFAADLAASGGAGVITADLTPDQGADWIAAADAYDLDKVFLVAPSSPPERLQLIARNSRGFIYAASVMGVTGTREQVGSEAEALVARTRAAIAAVVGQGGAETAAGDVADQSAQSAQYVCVGLGVSTPAQATEVGRYADGVIVGSAFVRPLLDETQPWDARLATLHQVVSDLAHALTPTQSPLAEQSRAANQPLETEQ